MYVKIHGSDLVRLDILQNRIYFTTLLVVEKEKESIIF